jgi:hypothetical protein
MPEFVNWNSSIPESFYLLDSRETVGTSKAMSAFRVVRLGNCVLRGGVPCGRQPTSLKFFPE